MAEIPYAAPQTFQIAQERPTDFNPEAVSRPYEQAARDIGDFSERLLHMQQATQINNGLLENSHAIANSLTKFKTGQDTDYANYSLQFATDMEQRKQQILDSGLDEPVQQALLLHLGQQQTLHSSDVAAMSYNGMKKDWGDSQDVLSNNLLSQASNSKNWLIRHSTLQDYQQSLTKGVQNGYMDADGAKKSYAAFESDFDKGNARADELSDPSTFLKQAGDKTYQKFYPTLDGPYRQALIKDAQEELKKRSDANDAALKDQMQNRLSSIQDNGMTMDDQQFFQKNMPLLSKSAQVEVKDHLDFANRVYDTTQKLNGMSKAEMQTYVSTLKPGPDDPDYTNKSNLAAGAQKYMAERATAIDNDGASVVAHEVNRQLPFQQQLAQSLQLQQKYGSANPRVTTDTYAKGFIESYKSANVTDRAAMVGQLRGQYGDYARKALSEIAMEKGAPGSLMFADAAPNDFAKIANTDYVSWGKLTEGMSATVKTNLENNLKSSWATIGPTIAPGNSQMGAATYNVFAKLAASYQAGGDNNAVADASQTLFKQYVMYQGTRMPRDILPSPELQARALAYVRNGIQHANIDAGGDNEAEFKNQIASAGNIQMDSTGKNFIVFYHGAFLKNKDGSTFKMPIMNAIGYQPAALQMTDFEKQQLSQPQTATGSGK